MVIMLSRFMYELRICVWNMLANGYKYLITTINCIAINEDSIYRNPCDTNKNVFVAECNWSDKPADVWRGDERVIIIIIIHGKEKNYGIRRN